MTTLDNKLTNIFKLKIRGRHDLVNITCPPQFKNAINAIRLINMVDNNFNGLNNDVLFVFPKKLYGVIDINLLAHILDASPYQVLISAATDGFQWINILNQLVYRGYNNFYVTGLMLDDPITTDIHFNLYITDTTIIKIKNPVQLRGDVIIDRSDRTPIDSYKKLFT